MESARRPAFLPPLLPAIHVSTRGVPCRFCLTVLAVAHRSRSRMRPLGRRGTVLPVPRDSWCPRLHRRHERSNLIVPAAGQRFVFQRRPLDKKAVVRNVRPKCWFPLLDRRRPSQPRRLRRTTTEPRRFPTLIRGCIPSRWSRDRLPPRGCALANREAGSSRLSC